MPISRISALHQAQHAMLNLLASCTGCAIGLYEPSSNREVREVLPPGEFESYCQKIHSFPDGKRLCHADHIERAKKVIENGTGGLTLCYAGVFNQALPIVVGGKVRAVLMYGQMWVEEDHRCAIARKCHESIIKRLEPEEDDELELRIHYDEIKQVSRGELKVLNEQLSLLQRFFYGILSEGLELDRHTEIVVHDIQTRLQPVLAHAQKLCQRLAQIAAEYPPAEALVATADELLQSILAMRVPIWNLGDFMPEYQFWSCPLKALVEEAVALYRAEAERKEVDVRIRLQEPSRIEMSRIHLQHAINNLLHNAIKYSYHGRYDLDRFVEVLGETDGFDYVLTFSNYGVGILPEEFDLIFEPGYKGELTYEEYRSGSGMGLTIAKEVIEKHHGTIQVESLTTGGDAHLNRFFVRLPRIQPVRLRGE